MNFIVRKQNKIALEAALTALQADHDKVQLIKFLCSCPQPQTGMECCLQLTNRSIALKTHWVTETIIPFLTQLINNDIP